MPMYQIDISILWVMDAILGVAAIVFFLVAANILRNVISGTDYVLGGLLIIYGSLCVYGILYINKIFTISVVLQ